MPETTTVVLISEHDGPDSRHLSASLTETGDLQINGHDIGPETSRLLGRSEYEWWSTVAAEHLTALVEALGGESGEEILVVLERRRAGDPRAAELEAILRSGVVPVRRSSW